MKEKAGDKKGWWRGKESRAKSKQCICSRSDDNKRRIT